jgi:hypothetical protein
MAGLKYDRILILIPMKDFIIKLRKSAGLSQEEPCD